MRRRQPSYFMTKYETREYGQLELAKFRKLIEDDCKDEELEGLSRERLIELADRILAESARRVELAHAEAKRLVAVAS